VPSPLKIPGVQKNSVERKDENAPFHKTKNKQQIELERRPIILHYININLNYTDVGELCICKIAPVRVSSQNC
jgi:hypothetical protein